MGRVVAFVLATMGVYSHPSPGVATQWRRHCEAERERTQVRCAGRATSMANSFRLDRQLIEPLQPTAQCKVERQFEAFGSHAYGRPGARCAEQSPGCA